MHGTWETALAEAPAGYAGVWEGYGPAPEQNAIVWKPRRPAAGAPLIVWFHGGGLVDDNREVPDALFDGRSVVVEARYRLSRGGHGAEDAVADAAAAAAWALDHAADWGADGARTFLGGMSAGAYLAAMAGMAPHLLAAHGHDHRKLRGLLLVSGQVFTHYQVKADHGDGNVYAPVVDGFAPFKYVAADVAPVLCVTGDYDRDMPTRAAANRLFVDVLRALGHPDATHRVLQGHDHGGAFESCGWLAAEFIRRLAPAAPMAPRE